MSDLLAPCADRYAAGRRLRQSVSRESLAEFTPPPDRDPLSIIAETERGRVDFLVEKRHELMSKGMGFAFLRGSADVMAQDLVRQTAPGLKAHACGDCHVMNFGAFESPEGDVLFDINDFDESLPDIDITFDLRRLATSVAVAVYENCQKSEEARKLARAAVRAYREKMHALARMSPIEVWSERTHLRDALDKLHDRVAKDDIHARLTEPDRPDDFPKLQKNAPRLCEKSWKLFHFKKLPKAQRIDVEAIIRTIAEDHLPPFVHALLQRFRFGDGAFKAVGVGSVGTYCAVGLYLSSEDKPLYLQLKEAKRSVLERAGAGSWDAAQSHRVVHGQKLLQGAPDIFLGATGATTDGREFYLRHLRKRRLKSIDEAFQRDAFPDYAALCARALARAHARTGDPATIAGYMGKSAVFDDAIASFAMSYAELLRADHAAFVARYSAG